MRAAVPQLPRRGARSRAGTPLRVGVISPMPAHGNRCYVKLAWIGLVSALALPAPAGAEIVSPSTGEGLLAVARDGSPRVAFLSSGDVVLARRGATGWALTRAGRAPGQKPVLSGLVVDRKGRSRVLVESENGSWLALMSSSGKLRVVARPSRGASLGPAGLALDAPGRPAFAYALR